MNSSTAIAFSIESPSATGQSARAIQPQRTSTLAPSMVILGTLLFLGSAPTAEARQISPSAVRPPVLYELAEVDRRKAYQPSDAIEHSIARLREFGRYSEDWDSNGALAPSQGAINLALQFLTSLEPWHPTPLATLSRLGEPVIEFEEHSTGVFSSIRFLDDRTVEVYSKTKEEPSEFVIGELGSPAVLQLLSTLNLPTL